MVRNDHPLVTFYIVAYNQQRYVREAVEGALAQTYSPLEIVLSDDGSQDRTFQIMREVATAYSGPHSVRLNRNEHNLGIIRHVSRVFAMASGELLVAGAGDDVSAPERTTALVEAWRAHSRAPDGLHSGYLAVTGGTEKVVLPPESLDLEAHCRRGTSNVLGATAAWTQRLLRKWGPLPPEGLAEDQILTFRALLSGGMLPVAKPLVRSHRSKDRRRTATRLERTLWSCRRNQYFFRTYEADLMQWSSRAEHSTERRDRLLKLLRVSRRRAERDAWLLARGRAFLALYCVRLACGVAWNAPRGIRARARRTLSVMREGVSGRRWTTVPDPLDHRGLRGGL